jgi:hypothetical protein
MPDHALGRPALPPRRLTEEAWLARGDCHACRHWQPGPVVVSGSTQGWCQPFEVNTAADFGCDCYTRKDHDAPTA